MPEEVKSVRSDAIIATGRSDYPNQVNNVLGFPYIFRGALDVRASTINEEMKIAAAHAIAELARKDVPDEVNAAYDQEATFIMVMIILFLLHLTQDLYLQYLQLLQKLLWIQVLQKNLLMT